MPVAIFSLEMSSIELVNRLMTTESGLESEKIKGAQELTQKDWDQLQYSVKALAKAPISIDDTPGLSVMEFRTKAKRLVKSKGVRFIIVDYLQLMQGPSELRGMREQEVAAISRTLKGNRNSRPMLGYLRESGSIEQDADIVMFVHRPDAIGLGETVEDKEYTEIIFAKNRNGQIGTIAMRYKGGQLKFVEANDNLAATFGSAMNGPVTGGDSGSQGFDGGYNPADDFGGGMSSGGFPGPGEFDNSSFM